MAPLGPGYVVDSAPVVVVLPSYRVVAFIAPVIKIILHASNAISYPILRPFELRLAAIWVA
jgi:hypothetical protein